MEPNASTQRDISIENRHGAFPPPKMIMMSSRIWNYTPRPLKFEQFQCLVFASLPTSLRSKSGFSKSTLFCATETKEKSHHRNCCPVVLPSFCHGVCKSSCNGLFCFRLGSNMPLMLPPCQLFHGVTRVILRITQRTSCPKEAQGLAHGVVKRQKYIPTIFQHLQISMH